MITAGEVLKRKRESLEKSLESVSVDTKIQLRFLKYIENDQFDKFDSDVFASGFIKIYSQYLGLDVNKLLALYRRSKPENVNREKKEKNTPKPKKKKIKGFNITPKLIAIITLTLFLLITLGYIGIQIYKFQKPPTLTVTQPQDGMTVTEKEIEIKGSTETTSLLEINGESINLDDTGWFEYKLDLNEGINSISIKARKMGNSSLETEKIIKVTYQTEEKPEETVQPEKPKNITVRLEITNSAAWVQLEIDNESKVSQILEPNTVQEYEVLESLRLTTGKLSSTKLYIDDQEYNLAANQASGVASISCNVQEDQLICD